MATAEPTATAPTPDVYLVWTPGGLPESLASGLESIPGVDLVSIARVDLVRLSEARGGKGENVTTLGEGWTYPVEVTAIDESFAALAPEEWHGELVALGDGAALLTETSGRVRGIGSGGTLVIEGVEWWVTGTIPDIVLGGAEVVVGQEAGLAIGVTTPRYALVSFDGDRDEFERQVRGLVSSDTPVRVRAPGETPFLRNGDAVLPQAFIKATFGEFGLRWNGGDEFEIEPDWVESNIATAEIPLIGAATCHAGILPSLEGAMTDLEQANLGFLVESFHGCFNPRFIGGTHSLSRHAWGAAVDINYTANQTGQTTTQDARLVETMERWGFTWGGNWLIPDAAHFEWVEPPRS